MLPHEREFLILYFGPNGKRKRWTAKRIQSRVPVFELHTKLDGISCVDSVNSSAVGAAATLALEPGPTEVTRQTTVAENKTNKRGNNKPVSVSNHRNDRNDNVVNGPKMPVTKQHTHPAIKSETPGLPGVSTPIKVVLPGRDQGLARAVPPSSPPLGGATEETRSL